MKTDIVIARKLLNLAQSAKERELEFNLSFRTVKRLLNQKNCYYTGVPFETEGSKVRTIDRVDAAKGYIEGNVVACTQEINFKKSNLSIQEIDMLFLKIKKHRRCSEIRRKPRQ